MDNNTVTVEIRADWPEADRQELMSRISEIEALLEKANALADALAQKVSEINFRMNA